MGKKLENLLIEDLVGVLRADSHLPDRLRKRIIRVGNDLNVPAFVRAVLLALVHCCDQPGLRVRLAEIQAWLGVHRQLWLSDRTIKAAISALVTDHGVQVGSCRGIGGQQGYSFITSPDEAAAAVKPLANQAKSLLHRCARLSPCRHYFRRMVGQLEVRF